jgi:CheY-like chemotaxis protein
MASILVAEDDGAVREFIARALRRDGHEVETVTDGQQALSALQARRFDMLLTDIVMPELDGITLALKVSSDFPDMPILLMTGYAAEQQRAHNLDALINDVISKPFTLEDICAMVNRTLGPAAGQSVH